MLSIWFKYSYYWNNLMKTMWQTDISIRQNQQWYRLESIVQCTVLGTLDIWIYLLCIRCQKNRIYVNDTLAPLAWDGDDFCCFCTCVHGLPNVCGDCREYLISHACIILYSFPYLRLVLLMLMLVLCPYTIVWYGAHTFQLIWCVLQFYCNFRRSNEREICVPHIPLSALIISHVPIMRCEGLFITAYYAWMPKPFNFKHFILMHSLLILCRLRKTKTTISGVSALHWNWTMVERANWWEKWKCFSFSISVKTAQNRVRCRWVIITISMLHILSFYSIFFLHFYMKLFLLVFSEGLQWWINSRRSIRSDISRLRYRCHGIETGR